jgi:membrane protease YdiL (CAAX protease family)
MLQSTKSRLKPALAFAVLCVFCVFLQFPVSGIYWDILQSFPAPWPRLSGTLGLTTCILVAVAVTRLLKLTEAPQRHYFLPKVYPMVIGFAACFLIQTGSIFIVLPISHYAFEWPADFGRFIASMVVLTHAAFLEELVFRVFVLSTILVLIRSIPVAIVIQAAWFSLGHRPFELPNGLLTFFFFFSGGLLLALILLHQRSFWAAAMAHTGWNAAVTMLIGGRLQYASPLLMEFRGPHMQAALITQGILIVVLAYRLRLPLFGGEIFGYTITPWRWQRRLFPSPTNSVA